MIRFQGIPVDAVIKVCDGKGLLIGGNRRTPSVYRSEERGQYAEAVDLTFYTAGADAPVDFKVLEIPRATDGQRHKWPVTKDSHHTMVQVHRQQDILIGP